MAWHLQIIALLAWCTLICAATKKDAKVDVRQDDVLKVETFEWLGGRNIVRSTSHVQAEDEGESAGQSAVPKKRRLEHDAPAVDVKADLVEALWDRPAWRDHQLDLKPTEGEHPCFAGFEHMINNTDRCHGWVREYPDVGGQVRFFNTGVERYSMFTLKAVVAGSINVWLEDGSTALHEDVAIKAANIYTNQYDIPELKPEAGSDSWMEHECKIMGSMPFMYTCSNRINVLVQECQVENAWVMSSDYLRNFPDAANPASPSNHDIIFYMCQELLDRTPNPYAAANTFAHELAHVIQGGFGSSFIAMAEGGATWLEGPLLHLPPRPMVYAWGFDDWNRINAAHFYATTTGLNSRKFYQIHGMFLAYLSQPELLGSRATSALQNFETFDSSNTPFGRAAYDYFLKYIGRPLPSTFKPTSLDPHDSHNAFATALLDYRVAIASQCIVDGDLRPKEGRYQMPQSMREHPYWDCTSFPTFWSASQASVDGARADIHYGGAAIYRLAMPEGASVALASDADPRVRTKVLASGARSTGHGAEVRELSPGEAVTLEGGARDIYVVQVNVDPEGELIGPHDRTELWRKTNYRCSGACLGAAWWAGRGKDEEYPANERSALRSPIFELPADLAELTFDAMWDLEGMSVDGQSVGVGCRTKGYDGVQVRVHTYPSTSDSPENVEVLIPDSGYGTGPGGESALRAFAESKLYSGSSACSNFEGWTGSSGALHAWSRQRFALSAFAGKRVRFEFLFASDGSEGGEGFWVSDIQVTAGANVIFAESFGNDTQMTQMSYTASRTAGVTGQDDGVPVVLGLPEGYAFDDELEKASQTRSAAWSAKWTTAAGSESAKRRAHLGWSYSAPILETKTALLHPGQEACMTLKAPFDGMLDTATLFLLVDKMGVGSVSLTVRSVEAPHAQMGDGKPLISSSPGVADPGTHRFEFHDLGPRFEVGQLFFLCVGVGEVRPLPADNMGTLPFLHLPLTEVSTAGTEGEPGATKLIVPPAAGQARTFQTSGLDPWAGNTFVLRAEFVEVVVPTSMGERSRAFLAP